MASIALSVISPILSILGKLMRFTSKFQVNDQTLTDLQNILEDLQLQLDLLYSANQSPLVMMNASVDSDFHHAIRLMHKKVAFFIQKVKGYREMNSILRFFRGDHIKREILQVQEIIIKMATDINHLEIKRELNAIANR